MAQRSPIQSFLSVVPSKSEPGEQLKQLPTRKNTAKRQARHMPSSSVGHPSGRLGEQTISPPERQGGRESRRSRYNPSDLDRQQRLQKLSQSRQGVSSNLSSRLGFELPLTSHQGLRQEDGFPLRKQQFSQSKTVPGGKIQEWENGGTSRKSHSFSEVSRQRRLHPDERSSSERAQRNTPNSTNIGMRGTRNRAGSRRRHRHTSPILYGLRLMILGVGLGVIAGTLLSIWDPATHYSADASGTLSNRSEQQESPETNRAFRPLGLNVLQITQEMTELKTQVQAITSQYPELTPGVFFVDLDNGAYLDLNSSTPFSAASTIKVPILIAFFQDVDAGKIRLDELVTMQQEHIATGSGEMQYHEPGSKWTAIEVAIKMITISDNTATNMLIQRLGGAESLNQRFRSWGLTSTMIQNVLPDLEGTNTTSPRDLVSLMAMVEQGQLLSLRGRDRVLTIMQATQNNSLLPQGLGEGAIIAHKTGDIGSSIGDVGMVDMPTGKRYLAAVIVKRPHNDPNAEDIIRQMSQVVYKSLNRQRGGSPQR